MIGVYYTMKKKLLRKFWRGFHNALFCFVRQSSPGCLQILYPAADPQCRGSRCCYHTWLLQHFSYLMSHLPSLLRASGGVSHHLGY